MRRSRLIRGAVVASAFVLAALSAVAQTQDAKPLYEKNCLSCHGASGKGDGPAGKMLKPSPGDLAEAKGKPDADVVKMIKEGGKALGKSAMMPAYGSKFSDEQIKALVAYIKELK